jgi:flagellar FliL protein
MADRPDASPAKAKKLVPMVLMVAIGVLAGGASGALVAGPLLARRVAPPPAAAPADPAGAAEAAAAASAAPGVLYAIDNLVLNPAGSNGTRFLLANLSFDLDSEATKSKLAAREPQVRDVLLRVLAAKSVDELADPAGREALKAELRDGIAQLFGAGAVRQVYLSQFVIQ